MDFDKVIFDKESDSQTLSHMVFRTISSTHRWDAVDKDKIKKTNNETPETTEKQKKVSEKKKEEKLVSFTQENSYKVAAAESDDC